MGPAEGGKVTAISEDLSLDKVRAELDDLAERRLKAVLTTRELERWHELVVVERVMLDREKRPGG